MSSVCSKPPSTRIIRGVFCLNAPRLSLLLGHIGESIRGSGVAMDSLHKSGRRGRRRKGDGLSVLTVGPSFGSDVYHRPHLM
jgi:hypothetical protein